MPRFLARLAVVALTAIALAGPAFAHAHLEASKPADGTVLDASPGALDLTFSERLNLKFSGVTLLGPDKAEIAIGTAALANGGKTMTVPLPERLAPGRYSVDWHVLSTDGHKTKGSTSFAIKP